MKLRDYLKKLRTDGRMVLGDRILWLWDKKNNYYFNQVIVFIGADTDGANYKFAAEPNVDFDKLYVVRAYTVDQCMTIMMDIERLAENYGESEVY